MNTVKEATKMREKLIAIVFIVVISFISGITFFQFGKDMTDVIKNVFCKNKVVKIDSDSSLNNSAAPNNSTQEDASGINDSNGFAGFTSDLKSFVKRIEIKLDKYVSVKTAFAHIDVNLNFFITGQIRSSQVLAGKENWLFYKSVNDGDPIADFQGTNSYSDYELQQAAVNIESCGDKLRAQGIDLYVMVLPNKEQIYSRFMPDEIIRFNDFSRTDRLVKYLSDNVEIPVIYPKQELLKYSDKYQLYYKYDTHWNLLGAYIAEQQLLFSMFQERRYLEFESVLEESLEGNTNVTNDLAALLGMKWFYNDDREYKIEGSFEIESFEDGAYFNEGAEYKKRILLIGDSFRVSLAPLLASDFSEVHIVFRRDYHMDMLNEIQPDIVVLEFVERYSNKFIDYKVID